MTSPASSSVPPAEATPRTPLREGNAVRICPLGGTHRRAAAEHAADSPRGPWPFWLPSTATRVWAGAMENVCRLYGDRRRGGVAAGQQGRLPRASIVLVAANRCHQRPAAAHNSRAIRANWRYVRPEYCLRRGLWFKDGPGSPRAATVSAWLGERAFAPNAGDDERQGDERGPARPPDRS